MTAMRVKALRQQPDGDGAIVVLEDVAGRLGLAFLIPINEANRLARIIGPAECRRTPVYELVCDLAATLDATVAGAVLDCESEGIYATLVLERHGAPIELRCHPADAIALAVSTQSPIHATSAAIAQACSLPSARELDEHERTIARWLEGVRPDDFGPRDEG
jgi:bifunctional DNase/RNase